MSPQPGTMLALAYDLPLLITSRHSWKPCRSRYQLLQRLLAGFGMKKESNTGVGTEKNGYGKRKAVCVITRLMSLGE
jgi:hypothetical protein